MAIKMSTALKGEILFHIGLIQALEFGVIQVYSGSPPDSADDAPTGALLGSITGDGLTWTAGSQNGGLQLIALPSLAYVVKPPTQSWVLKVSNSGTAGWWRFRSNNDAEVRMDGLVTNSYQELYIGDPMLTLGEERFIELFQIGFFW